MIDRLELLLALSRERHFGRAAVAVGVSQQALSAGIKQLEDRLGALLVQRGSRFHGFTAEGERVLGWARRIVADKEAMQAELRSMKQGLSGHIRLAVIPTALPMVHRLTTPFQARFPGVRFTVRSAASSDILEQLREFEADAGITYLDAERLGRVTSVPLYEERHSLLVAADSPWAGRAAIGWAEAAGLPLCLLTQDMQNRRMVDAELRASRPDGMAAPALESNSVVVLLTHVRTGRWVSILPSLMAEDAGPGGAVRTVPLVDPVVAQRVGLVTVPRDPMVPTVAALLRVAEAVVADPVGTGRF